MTSPKPSARSIAFAPATLTRRWGVAVACFGVLAAFGSAATDKTDEKSNPLKPLVLFDGKTLEGW